MEAFIQESAKTLFLRLEPGEELFQGIKDTCARFGICHGTITSCIGSLKQTSYTYVQRSAESTTGMSYRETIVSDVPNELICGQGTIGISDGKADIHMHALMCDVDGKLFAGHMMPGNLISATMEISIAVADGVIERSMDHTLKFPLFHFNG